MNQEKELPSEYVSIRTVWLQSINDCRKAIGQRAIQEPNFDRQEKSIGDRTIVYTVDAFYYSLVDCGEAIVRSSVDKYREKEFTPRLKEIWSSWQKNKVEDDEDDETDDLAHFKGLGLSDKEKRKPRSINACWSDHARESMKLFDYIIQTLNKYNMLFEKQPEGYSNVEMRSIEQ